MFIQLGNSEKALLFYFSQSETFAIIKQSCGYCYMLVGMLLLLLLYTTDYYYSIRPPYLRLFLTYTQLLYFFSFNPLGNDLIACNAIYMKKKVKRKNNATKIKIKKTKKNTMRKEKYKQNNRTGSIIAAYTKIRRHPKNLLLPN